MKTYFVTFRSVTFAQRGSRLHIAAHTPVDGGPGLWLLSAAEPAGWTQSCRTASGKAGTNA